MADILNLKAGTNINFSQVSDDLEINADNQIIELIAVSNSAPSECSIGDKYYNTTNNRIYTATATDTWSSEGEIPKANIIYVVLNIQETYAYNGNELVSIGGGSSSGGETIKIGTIFQYSGTTAPDNYMICDGSAISRTTYADLFAVIGTTYGSGDGSTTFNLPNLKGKVAVGLDSTQTEFDTLGETGGSKTHSHPLSDNGYAKIVIKGTGHIRYQEEQVTAWRSNFEQSGGSTQSCDTPEGYGATLGGNTDNSSSLQPYLVINYIIKVSQTTPTTAQIVNSYSNSTTNGYSCNYINQLRTYIAAETAIGTFIDGKTIYRQVITGQHSHNDVLIQNVDKIINFYGTADVGSGVMRALPYSEVYNGNNFNCTINLQSNNIQIVVLGNGVASTTPSNSVLIIEYTKIS